MKKVVFGMMVVSSLVAPASRAAVEGETVKIRVVEDMLFDTDLPVTLKFTADPALVQAVQEACSPRAGAKSLDLRVTLDRRVGGSDTQNLRIEGTAVCL